MVGSAPYMSPEQAEGRKVDARSDIFSFGSVLYEMLTGKRAFSGKTRMATMAAVLNSEPEPVSKLMPDIPREVERCVSRCLRKDLDRRSPSMAEIRVALQDLKEESESGSLAAAAVPAVRHRRRWPYYAAGGLLCVAAITAFWLLGPGRQAAPLHATVLTKFPSGTRACRAFSPDANQFAFAWDGDVWKGPPHVYISLVGKGTPLRLTPENETALTPAWSPDGQSIAYIGGKRECTKSGVMPTGRHEPQDCERGGLVSAFSWSPDSKMAVVERGRKKSGISAIHVAPADGGEPRQLLDPLTIATGPANGDHDPALSPDGRRLIFSRFLISNDLELYLADFDAGHVVGAPRQLTHDQKTKSGPIWTNDGKEIIGIARPDFRGKRPSRFTG